MTVTIRHTGLTIDDLVTADITNIGDANYIRQDGTTPYTTGTIKLGAGTDSIYSLQLNGIQTGGYCDWIDLRLSNVSVGSLTLTAGFVGFTSALGIFAGVDINNNILIAGGAIQYTASSFGHTFLGTMSCDSAAAFQDKLSGATVRDVYSQYGVAADIFTLQTDATDRLVITKSESASSGIIRALTGVCEYTDTAGNSTGNYVGITGYGGTASTSTKNLTIATLGGGIVGGFFEAIHTSSGTVTQASGVVGLVTGTSGTGITDAFSIQGLGPAPGAGQTYTRGGAAWFRDASGGGAITTQYGVRIDALTKGTTKYQLALDGTGAGSGIFFNTPTNTGFERVWSSASNTLDLTGRTNLNININSTPVLAFTSSLITASLTFKPQTGATGAGSAPMQWTSGSLLTSPIVGADEFLTDKRYFTITTGTARKEYTLNNAALTSGTVPVTTTNGRLTDGGASSTELSYLSGVTSAIQTQLNSKPKTLFVHFADANNGTTVETDLYSDTLAAGQLATNGDKLENQYSGVFSGAVSSTQQLKIYFGGTAIFDSGALSIGVATPTWDIYVSVVRVSASVVRCVVQITTASAALAATSQYTEVTGLTLANTQVVKITGTAAGVGGGSNQITAKFGTINYAP